MNWQSMYCSLKCSKSIMWPNKGNVIKSNHPLFSCNFLFPNITTPIFQSNLTPKNVQWEFKRNGIFKISTPKSVWGLIWNSRIYYLLESVVYLDLFGTFGVASLVAMRYSFNDLVSGKKNFCGVLYLKICLDQLKIHSVL